MEIKIKFIYLFNIHKQLSIPIHRHEYNLHSNTIDLFEIKKQNINFTFLDYKLYIFLERRVYKLYLENYNSLRLYFINGINVYDKINFTKSFNKLFYLKIFATKIDSFYIKYYFNKKDIFSQNIFYIYIPKGIFLRETIEIFSVSIDFETKILNTRYIIYIDKGSYIRVFESYRNLTKNKKRNNSIIEIYQKSYSSLFFLKKKDDRLTYFFDILYLLQEDRSECNINYIIIYGLSIVNYLSIYQIGKEIHSYITGFNICQGHLSHNSLIEHSSSNGKSRDIYKGIYNGIASSYFNNKIIVLKTAKKTDASQHNKNILLINPIHISSNPKLEIFSNNIKCYHGCTLGHLIPIEIFYLQSRGLSKTNAINKLLLAFANSILESIPCQRIKYLIIEKININVILK